MIIVHRWVIRKILYYLLPRCVLNQRGVVTCIHLSVGPKGGFKNFYELLNWSALTISTLYHIISFSVWVRYFVWNIRGIFQHIEAETKLLPFWRRYIQTHFGGWKLLYFDASSLKCVPQCSVNNKSALVQIMAWRWTATSHFLNQW